MSIVERKFMDALAKKIDAETEKEYLEFEELGKDFSPELDSKLREVARFYDQKYLYGQKRMKKIKRVRVLKRVMSFLIVFLALNTIAIGTSDAYRQFVFQSFENQKNQSITFHNQTEKSLLGEWSNYWYPAYLPEGYEIIGVEDVSGKCILIQADEGTLLISEYAAGTELSVDTKHSDVSDIRINNSVGKRISFGNQTMIVYPTEDAILEFSFGSEISEEDVIEIAKHMQYIEIQ